MDAKLRKLTISALMAALVFAATYFVHIPVPGTHAAYFNVGDIVVYLAALIPGGWYGAAASALGSATADLISGAAVYAPATFVIKGVMTLIVWLIICRHGKSIVRFSTGSAAAGLVMVAGYWLYEFALFGWAYAAAAVPFNMLQYACGAVFSVLVFVCVRNVPFYKLTAAGGRR